MKKLIILRKRLVYCNMKAIKFLMWVASRKVVNSFIFSSSQLFCKDPLIFATQNDILGVAETIRGHQLNRSLNAEISTIA